MGLFIQEDWVDATQQCRVGSSGIYEAYQTEIGKLFRDLQREHGRCTGKVYIDRKDGTRQHIGWAFEKMQKYEDCNKWYLQETWVTVHKAEPTRTIEYHYADLQGGNNAIEN